MPWIQGVWELKDPQNHRTQFDSDKKTLIYFGPDITPPTHPLVVLNNGEMFMYDPKTKDWALLTVTEVGGSVGTEWDIGVSFTGKIQRTGDGISLHELSFYGPSGGGVTLQYQRQGTREEERTGYALLIVFAVFLVAWYIATKH